MSGLLIFATVGDHEELDGEGLSQADLMRPVARSVSRAEPILTTIRRASAHSGRTVSVVESDADVWTMSISNKGLVSEGLGLPYLQMRAFRQGAGAAYRQYPGHFYQIRIESVADRLFTGRTPKRGRFRK